MTTVTIPLAALSPNASGHMAVLTGDSTFTDTGFWKPTLAGAPPASAKVSAVEVQVKALEDQGAPGGTSFVAFANPIPYGYGSSIPGSWSGAGGTSALWRASPGAQKWTPTVFSVWLTEYLQFTSASGTQNRLEIPSPGLLTNQIDIRMLVRRANFTTWGSRGGTLLASNFVFELRGEGSDLKYRHNDNGSATYKEATASWVTDLGCATNTWEWIRVTFDATNKVRFWRSTDGVSWTVNKTVSIVSTVFNSFSSPILVGNGLSASSNLGVGWDGDIAVMEYRSTVGGSLVEALAVQLCPLVINASWAGTTGTWQLGGGAGNIWPTSRIQGAYTGTARVRFVATTPTRWDQWWTFVDANKKVEITELLIEFLLGGGPHLGLHR